MGSLKMCRKIPGIISSSSCTETFIHIPYKSRTYKGTAFPTTEWRTIFSHMGVKRNEVVDVLALRTSFAEDTSFMHKFQTYVTITCQWTWTETMAKLKEIYKEVKINLPKRRRDQVNMYLLRLVYTLITHQDREILLQSVTTVQHNSQLSTY